MGLAPGHFAGRDRRQNHFFLSSCGLGSRGITLKKQGAFFLSLCASPGTHLILDSLFKADLSEAWETTCGGGSWRKDLWNIHTDCKIILPRSRENTWEIEGDLLGVLLPRGTWDTLLFPSES